MMNFEFLTPQFIDIKKRKIKIKFKTYDLRGMKDIHIHPQPRIYNKNKIRSLSTIYNQLSSILKR